MAGVLDEQKVQFSLIKILSKAQVISYLGNKSNPWKGTRKTIYPTFNQFTLKSSPLLLTVRNIGILKVSLVTSLGMKSLVIEA